MHARQRVRSRIGAQLFSWTQKWPVAPTFFADTPVYAVQTQDLPYGLYYNTGDRNVTDEAERRQVGSDVVRYLREMVLSIEARVAWAGSGALAQELGLWAEQIELSMEVVTNNPVPFADFVQSIDYKGTEWGQNKDGDKAYGFVTVNYAVQFLTEHSDAQDDFTGIDADYHLGAPGDQPAGPHAEDTIDFP